MIIKFESKKIVKSNGTICTINSKIYGNYNSIFGNKNRVHGNGNLIFGNKNKIFCNNSKIIGNNNVIKGNLNILNGNNNIIMGNKNKITGCFNETNGKNNRVFDNYGNIRGNNNKLNELLFEEKIVATVINKNKEGFILKNPNWKVNHIIFVSRKNSDLVFETDPINQEWVVTLLEITCEKNFFKILAIVR